MKSILLLAATTVLLLIPHSVRACSCVANSPATAYNSAGAVFIGKMVSGTETHVNDYGNGKEVTIESGEVLFEVSKVYKGSLGNTVTISVASMKGTSCGTYGLRRDTVYIVWAHLYGRNSDKLATGPCSLTTTVDSTNSKEQLDFLNNLPPKGSGGNIIGKVWLDSLDVMGGGSEKLAGVSIAIESVETGQIRYVKSDKEGSFGINGIPAGKYKIIPKAPNNFYLEKPVQEVELNDLGTVTTRFEFQYDGHIVGRIVDRNGTLFNFGSVRIDDERLWLSGYSSGNDGKYKIDGVPPGRYRLFITIENTANGKDKKYYYPGTYDIRKAKWITVGLSKTVEAADFILPPEFRLRTFTGRVFNIDGSPVVDATVSLVCPKRNGKVIGILDNFPSRIETDEFGTYTIQGFEGFNYWLGARLDLAGGNERGLSYSLPQYIDAKVSGNKFDLLLTDAPPVDVDCP